MTDGATGVTTGEAVGGIERSAQAERRAALLAFAYFFCLMGAYFILRPVRDEMAVRSGVTSLPSLFLGTFVVSLLLAPLYGALVANLKRSRFIAITYSFLLCNILMFWWAWTFDVAMGFATRAFFVWLSVFNVFAVSVFWSFMADIFRSDQARRLYPMIAAGGSLGGVAGAGAVTAFAPVLHAAGLLLVAAALLALAMTFALWLEARAGVQAQSHAAARTDASDRKMGGGWLAGLQAIFRSTYVGGVALWVVLLSLAGTFLYAMQTAVVGEAGLESGERIRLFGAIDLACNIAIPVLQFTIARLVLTRARVGVPLGLVALVFAAGFCVLAANPTLAVLVVMMVAQRTTQFAFSNPALQALWNVTPREDKYKAKNVVDVAIFRGADLASANLFNALQAGLGMGLSTLAWLMAPVAGAWFALSILLGRRHDRLLAAAPADPPQQEPKP